MKPCIWSSPYLVTVKSNMAAKGAHDIKLAIICLVLGVELQTWFLYLNCMSKGIK